MHSLWAFLLLAATLSVTPGPDDVLVIRNALLGGPRLGATTALGVATGSLAWGAAVATGLAAFSSAGGVSRWIRLAGAAYLILLGIVILSRCTARASVASGRHRSADLALRRPNASAYTTGLLSDLLNPKIGAFYVAVVPQFIPPGGPVLSYSLLLCGLDVALASGWFLLLTWAVHAARFWVQRPGVVRWSERLCGVVMVALGAVIAIGM